MSNALRQVHDGRLTFRGQTYSHPALAAVEEAAAARRSVAQVWVCADGPFKVAVWTHKQRRSDTPLCTASAVRPRAADPAQLALGAV